VIAYYEGYLIAGGWSESLEADCLIRIRSNCCLYGLPGKYHGRGQPKKHVESNAWKSCTIDVRTFSWDWNSSTISQTPWKI